MLMSRTSRLAVEVLVELAGQGSQEWTTATELGRRIDSDVPFLKQVLNRLTRASLARARPGRSGGYQLAHGPRELSLSAVIQAIDGRDVRKQCLLDSAACDGTKLCRLSPTWHPIRDVLITFLETETIQSIAERNRSCMESFDLTDLDQATDQ